MASGKLCRWSGNYWTHLCHWLATSRRRHRIWERSNHIVSKRSFNYKSLDYARLLPMTQIEQKENFLQVINAQSRDSVLNHPLKCRLYRKYDQWDICILMPHTSRWHDQIHFMRTNIDHVGMKKNWDLSNPFYPSVRHENHHKRHKWNNMCCTAAESCGEENYLKTEVYHLCHVRLTIVFLTDLCNEMLYDLL